MAGIFWVRSDLRVMANLPGFPASAVSRKSAGKDCSVSKASPTFRPCSTAISPAKKLPSFTWMSAPSAVPPSKGLPSTLPW